MAQQLVLIVVGQVVDASTPDAAVVKAKANLSAPVAGDIKLSAFSAGQVRSVDAASTPAPPSMSAALAAGGGKITAASLQAYINNFFVR